MTVLVKNLTAWQPPSGTGYIIAPGQNFLVTNLGNFLVTNTGNFLVTNGTYDINRYPTLWTASGV